MLALKNQEKKIDRLFLLLIIALTLFGLLMVFESSSVTAFRDFGDKFYYLRQQALWACLGFVGLFFLSKYNYHKLEKFAPLLFGLTLVLLVLVLLPGVGLKFLGARRWINFFGFGFQPAELAKLTFILYIASIFSKKSSFWHFFIFLVISVVLIMLEPDLGTTIVIVGSGFCLYFVSGAPLFNLFLSLVIGFAAGIALIFTSAYRQARLLTFLDMSRDPLGASYHIRQILLALGSGGFWGLGIGASRQKFEYLPEAMTDSIFAIIAEEFGFIGASILIFLLLAVALRALIIAQNAPDKFGRFLAAGISSWFWFQILINLASQVALVPLTGIPLLFVSYGGSSLIIALLAAGIVLNISLYSVKQKEKSKSFLQKLL